MHIRRTTRAALFAAAAPLCLTTAAMAQDDGLVADEAPGEREVITVYGTKNPLPVFDYPGQVSVLERDEIETLAPSAVSDMLREVPGLEFSGGPRRTGEVPSLRGLSGENVLVLFDGARQSFLSAHDGRFFLDPELIQTAEVLRGPASALYGSGAVGGVLAFETADAADLLAAGESSGVRLRAGHQGVNEESLVSLTGYARLDGFDLVGNIATRDSGDIALGSGASLSSDDDITSGFVKGGYDLSDAVRVELSWRGFRNTAIEPNNGQGVATSSDPILGADVEKDIATDTFTLGATFDPASELIDAALTLYDTSSAVDERDLSTDRTTVRDIDTTGVSARNSSRFSAGGADVVFTLGGDWHRDAQTGTDSDTADGARGGVPNGDAVFYGAFAQLETSIERPFGLPGELLIVPGVRFDRFESEVDFSAQKNSDEAVSPRLAASYGPIGWLRVFASYSAGFRAPSINELFLDGVHFPVPHPVLFDPGMGAFEMVNNNFVPNPDLKPEATRTVEVGAGLDFHGVFADGDRFQTKVSYFETEAEDLIDLSVDFAYAASCFSPPFFPCDAGTTTSANVARAELEGVEAEALYDSRRLRARATFSTVDGENARTGEKLGTLTPARLNLDLRWKLPARKLALGARLQVADDFDKADDPAFARDGYSVVDLYATWAPAFLDGFRLDAGVDNVFDEDYERVFAGVSEPGLNAKATVSYSRGF